MLPSSSSTVRSGISDDGLVLNTPGDVEESEIARSSNGLLAGALGLKKNGIPQQHTLPLVASHDDLSFETDDMPVPVPVRAQLRIALGEDHPDMGALFEQKLAIEGASPKPCIVPGNALQLIDEDPAASRSHTPSSVIILNDDDSSHGQRDVSVDSSAEHEQEQAQAQDARLRRPIPRVRFRSRVRITSGLRRSKHHPNPTSSPSSSASGSPSSSISAPLRWQPDENGTWGPLGRRLSAYAHSNRWQKRNNGSNMINPAPHQQQVTAHTVVKSDERTPLIRSNRHVAYVSAGLDGGVDADDERVLGLDREFDSDEEELDSTESALRAAALKREEDATFGAWPWRLFNRHWWWFHAEPIFCFCCADDSEYEE